MVGTTPTPWWLLVGVWAVENNKSKDLLDVLNSEHPDHTFVHTHR